LDKDIEEQKANEIRIDEQVEYGDDRKVLDSKSMDG